MGCTENTAWFRGPDLRGLPLHTISCGACLSPSGSSVFLSDKELGLAVPCAALKKLPYRQVIKTRAQEGICSRAGELLEPSPKGSRGRSGVVQVLWVSVGRVSPGPGWNHHRQVLRGCASTSPRAEFFLKHRSPDGLGAPLGSPEN